MGWYNSDGLYVKFGTEEATVGKVGMHKMAGPQHMVEVFVPDMTALATGATIWDYNTVIPKNARIEKIEVITQTAVTSGGSATLNVGLIRTDITTELDYDGFVAALAIASFNAVGETVSITAGATSAGALLGTTLSNNGYITIDYDTAAFTAGAIRIRIYYVRDLAS